MADNGSVKTLYTDESKQNALFPRTVLGAVSGLNGETLQQALDAKQDKLVSGTNIKTLNSQSILGSGDVSVQPTLVSGTNIKTINNQSILSSGNIDVSKVTASGSGTSTTEVKYLTIDGTEYKIDGGLSYEVVE